MHVDFEDLADEFESFERFGRKSDGGESRDRNRNKNRQVQAARKAKEREKNNALKELASEE